MSNLFNIWQSIAPPGPLPLLVGVAFIIVPDPAPSAMAHAKARADGYGDEHASKSRISFPGTLWDGPFYKEMRDWKNPKVSKERPTHPAMIKLRNN